MGGEGLTLELAQVQALAAEAQELFEQAGVNAELHGVMVKVGRHMGTVDEALRQCDYLAGLEPDTLNAVFEQGRQNFVTEFPERAHEADYASVRAEREAAQDTPSATDRLLASMSKQPSKPERVTRESGDEPSLVEAAVVLPVTTERANKHAPSSGDAADTILDELALVNARAEQAAARNTDDFSSETRQDQVRVNTQSQASGQERADEVVAPAELRQRIIAEPVVRAVVAFETVVEVDMPKHENVQRTAEVVEEDHAKSLGEAVWHAAQGLMRRVHDQYTAALRHDVSESEANTEVSGDTARYGLEAMEELAVRTERYEDTDFTATIQEILELEPDDALESLLTQDAAPEALPDEAPMATSATVTEFGEYMSTDAPIKTSTLQEHVAMLEVTEPKRAERMKPLVDEIEQIVEKLVELQVAQKVAAEVVSDGDGLELHDVAEYQEKAEIIEARLEVICMRLLQEVGIDPTPEIVQQFIQELLSTAHADAHHKQLTASQKANMGTREYKLASSLAHTTQVVAQPKSLIQIAARLVTRRSFVARRPLTAAA